MRRVRNKDEDRGTCMPVQRAAFVGWVRSFLVFEVKGSR